ncbi:MAG TPA: MBL fold hydrolase [Clostridiales bacterium]|nr:MBL fold hydrolase [Clostridiales bacterium]
MKVIPIVTGMIAENTYIVFQDAGREAILIDPGDDAQNIIEALAENKLTPTHILLTHGHFDHVGAVEAIREKYGAKVLIHKADAELLARPNAGLFQRAGGGAAADELLEGGETLQMAGLTVGVLHTPGHTGGCVCYRIGDVLFSGDTLFMQSIGRTDFSESDPQAMRDSLEKLAKLEQDYTVMPGHGAATSLAEEKKYNPYLSM